MAAIELKIVTKWDSTQKALGDVKETLKATRKELVSTQNDTAKLSAAEQKYVETLNYRLQQINATKSGMAAFTAQEKLLTAEAFELNAALGAGHKYTALLSQGLEEVHGDMAKYAKAAEEAAAAQKKVSNAMKDSEGGVKSYLSKISGLAKNILTFQLIMGPIKGLFSSVNNAVRDSVRVAGEAEQVYSKLSTVFAGLEDSARSAADSIAASLGVSGSTAAGALSTVGDLLQAQGMGTNESLAKASEWVSQFQDIIAFKDINMTLDEFAQNFMSGAAGNLRNFRTFGSIVKESAVNARLAAKGMDTLTGSELELAKMTARAEIALEQQANAVGATGREWDTTLSISRRFNEANKELKENLGDILNKVLNPLKSKWAEVADQINKAAKANKDYNEGAKNINVYDLEDDKDRLQFVKNISKALNAYDPTLKLDPDEAASKILEIMTKFHATLDDVDRIYGNINEEVHVLLEAEDLILQKEREREKHLSDLRSEWALTVESAQKVVDSLDELKGINLGDSLVYDFSSVTMPTTDSQLETWSGLLQFSVEQAIQGALDSFEASDWMEFTNALDNALGASEASDGFNVKLEEAKKLYSVINALIRQDNTVTEQELGWLQQVESIYRQILQDVQAIADAEQRRATYNDGLTSMRNNTADYQKQLEQFGMTDQAKQFDDLERTYQAFLKSLGDITKDELSEINDAYQRQTDALGELFEKQAQADRNNLFKTNLGTLNSGVANYQKQIGQFDMSDREKQFDDLERAFKELKSTMSDLTEDELKDLNAVYELQKGALDELIKKQEEEARRSKFETQLSSILGNASTYQKQLDQFNMTDNEKALDDLKRAYEAQLAELDLTSDEIRELDNAYQNQVKTLQELQQRQTAYNKALEAENARKAKQQELQRLYEEASNAAAKYQKQLEQLGMNDYQKTMDDLSDKAYGSKSQQEKDAWESAAKSFRELTFQGLLDSFSGLAYESDKAKIGMSELDKSLYDLNQSYTTALNSMDLSYDEQMLLYNNYLDQYNALVELNKLQNEYNEELEKQRQIEANQQAWKNLGSNALNSLGTVGSAVNTMVNGEGDIWTRLLTVVLDIAQQSEYWEDVVEILNEVLEPVLPLVGMIAYTLKNLKPVFDVIAFVLKVVASAIALILAGVNYVIDIIRWLGDWLAAAISNVAIKVYNLFHWNNKDEVTMPKLKNYLSETTEQTQKILEEIWHEEKKQNEQVDLSFLQELLRAGIIDEAGYNLRAGVKQAGLNWDTVNPSSGYVDWSNKGATVVTNKVNITIEGNVTKDNLEELEKVLGKYYGLQPTGLAY